MEDVVRIGLPLGECVGLQHRQSWLRFPPNTDEEVHSCWASKQHTKGNFEEKDYKSTNSKDENMRLNLLQHLTGENFHKTHYLRFLVMIPPLKIIT